MKEAVGTMTVKSDEMADVVTRFHIKKNELSDWNEFQALSFFYSILYIISFYWENIDFMQ